MNRLRDVAQQWDQQTDSQLRRVNVQQTLSSQALSEFDAESNKQMQMIINLVNSVQQTRESFKVIRCYGYLFAYYFELTTIEWIFFCCRIGSTKLRRRCRTR